ncbi:uncharacterized protein LOC110271624 [Arachis ipaensis]|uniref:uncharacterized protein LOC110271624 n=1 Tax=Arachis ipaensis TaxID=130454 RepID=UPI000A2B4AE3|nr:uncharacterized protein LOC110271624 [Arachis ipaensis]XP_029145853.1 uncharacterized protein LOC114924738 [Arachis hypogaea]
MSDRISLKVYYNGQTLSQTSEGIRFMCQNSCDIVPFIILFEKLKSLICEMIDLQILKRVTSVLYKYPIIVFGGFIQFEMKYVTCEVTMQEMFSIYQERRSQDFAIELYVEFEHLTYGVEEADGDMDWEGYNSESEDEFEGNYEIDDPNVDGDDVDCANEPDIEEVTNVLASQHLFGEPSFMRDLHLAALNAPEFSKYANASM